MKILLNIKNKIPLPRLQGYIYLHGMGAGGGEGGGKHSCRARLQARPGVYNFPPGGRGKIPKSSLLPPPGLV